MKLQIVGWKPGLRAVSLIAALRPYIGSLSGSKFQVERLLDGFPMEIDVPDAEFETFRASLENLGARCA